MSLLDLFKKEKYTYRCNLLNRHLHFTSRNSLDPCCCINVGPAFISDLKESTSILSFIKNKKKYIKMFKDGKIPNGCANCTYLEKYSTKEIKEKNLETNTTINNITLNHYISCDCACIYCSQGNKTLDTIKENYDKKIYDVKNFIKELYEKELIDTKSLNVIFQGGNISCLKDHEEILNLFIENGVNKIIIYTNNIVYIPLIEKLLAEGKGEIFTSLDCASKDLFLKIKQVNKFDQYIDNLKRYIAAAGSKSIIVKYIIINNVNDNMEEISKFVDLMLEIGVSRISFDIDYRDIITHTETKLPEHYKDLVKDIHTLCQSKNIEYAFHDYAEMIVNRGYTMITR